MTKDEALNWMIENHKLESLQQPTQEPVAYFKKWEDKSGEHKDIKFSNSEGYKPLYTQPAPRPTQEPVAWMHRIDEDITEFTDFQACPKCEPLYTHPKEWQGLSNDEIWNIANFLGKNKEWDYPVMFAKTIEQALKEKTHE